MGRPGCGLWAAESIGGTKGVFEGNGEQILIQMKAVAYTLVYSGVASYLLLKAVDETIGFKAAEHDERVGLDLIEHTESAYTLVE